MDIFGENWKDHQRKIELEWLNTVEQQDTVLVPGDISWAMHTEEAYADLDFLDGLPGKKILCQGNHDYWWNSTNMLNDKYVSLQFIRNNYGVYENYAICGTRGWVCPNDSFFSSRDEKIYARELRRLQMSMDAALAQEFQQIIVMLHYPPCNDKLETSGFIEMIESYPVRKVVYGHLHGDKSFETVFEGERGGIQYDLISADYIGFRPVRIL